MGALAVIADVWQVGPEIELHFNAVSALRPMLGLAGVAVEDGIGVRGEFLLQYHLHAYRPRGWGVYGGVGLAYLAAQGISGRAYLVALVGAQRDPGGRGGWFAEAGLGGGVRVAVGWRRFRGRFAR